MTRKKNLLKKYLKVSITQEACFSAVAFFSCQVFDARHVTTAKEMFEVLKKHLAYATNGGNVRPVITIFPQRREPHKDFCVWNSQLIKYAGYRQPDGTVIGDPGSVEFTEVNHVTDGCFDPFVLTSLSLGNLAYVY